MQVRLVSILSLALVAACSSEDLLPTYDLSGRTMGTTFNITVVAPSTAVELDALEAAIYAQLDRVDRLASTYREDSELSGFNANTTTGWVNASADFCNMIAAALEMSSVTDGAFDITVGPLVNLWGFGPAQREYELPTGEEITALLDTVGYEKLQTDCEHDQLRKTSADLYVDLSGWAKGHAVDRVAELLDQHQLANYLVEIGGEMRLKGHNASRNAFSVAIEKPSSNGTMSFTVVKLTDTAVATSGDYRNFFEEDGRRYSHSIDPRTGYPVSHELTGVTVVSDSTAYADAMATALLVLGPEQGPTLAEALSVAAYFLVRTDDGVEELTTTRFEQIEHERRM